MRCKTCDYRLWNLTSRVCPECGTRFKTSDFEFLINSVQFSCPHCNQSYYGTGDKGHLVPPDFDCVSCRRHIHMDEMIVLPTAGVEEEQTKADTMPWFERERLGNFKAWFSTIGMALSRPQRLIELIPRESKFAPAARFAILTLALSLLIGTSPFLLPMLISLAAFRSGIGVLPFLGSLAVVVGGVVLCSVAVVVLSGLLVHGLLRLTGPTEHTMERTYHCMCYSSGASVLTAIPCFGPFLGWIWWAVSAILMIRQSQRVHGGRAAFAVLTIPGLTLGTIVGLYTWMMVSMMSGTGPFAMANSTASTETILVGLLDYADDRDELPEHAIQLVVGGFVTGFDLVATGSDTFEKDVPIADTNLDKFTKLPSQGESKAVQAAIDALPAGTIAHRLGDFVFTYHGIDLTTADPGLWLVILSPDPDVNPAGVSGTVITFTGPGMTTTTTTGSGGMLIAGQADGMPMYVQVNSLGPALTVQNVLRAKYNLPPLPDPATVTHAKAAVAGNQPQTSETIPDPSEPDDSSSPEDEHP